MTINCKGKLLNLDSPIVMGILNITPDSFFDGGRYSSEKQILIKCEHYLNEGASIIDIGGYSSRPNAIHISVEEEITRVIPAIKLVIQQFPDAILSVDTFRSEVAKAALNEGAAIINDISGGDLDSLMYEVVKAYKAPYIMMHMRGTPQTMQKQTSYQNMVKEVTLELAKKVTLLKTMGIADIIIDPGFGFAKTIPQNFELLNSLELFSIIETPVLVGLSRKSMIYETLNIDAAQSLNGTTALHMIALQKGATILRVHDVKEAKECIALFKALKNSHD